MTAAAPALDMHGAFLAHIIAAPDDDAPRLIYSDWLEENGEPERSEFIRVQCEMSATPLHGPRRCPYTLYCRDRADPEEKTRGGRPCACCRRYNVLRRRERDLLEAHGDRWRLEATGHVGCPLTGVSLFRRGFVEAVTLTAGAWLGGPCGRCGGRPRGVSAGPGRGWITCPDCRGALRVAGHADALLAAAPIREVTLTTWPEVDEDEGADGSSWWVLRGTSISRPWPAFDRARHTPLLLSQAWPGLKFTLPEGGAG